MTYDVHIPESVAAGIQLPSGEVESRLRAELATALYSQGLLAFGKARELSGITRFEFADFVTKRGISRQYSDLDLAHDLAYANGQ